MHSYKYILLTIDVEDWFQVENFKPWIPFSTWDSRELRVERNVHRLLDLFDSVAVSQSAERRGQNGHKDLKVRRWEGEKVGRNEELTVDSSQLRAEDYELRARSSKLKQLPGLPEADDYEIKIDRSSRVFDGASQLQAGPYGLQATSDKLNSNRQPTTNNHHHREVKATFFVLGWLAERLPHLVREIAARGHEVASHGCNHELPTKMSEPELRKDVSECRKRLEDFTGSPVFGYRAPSFAIDDRILSIIGECGYRYDSSYNSFGLHGRYGRISLNGNPRHGIAHKISDDFYELPISNLPLSTLGTLAHFRHFRHSCLPFGGGGYFRLIPFPVFSMGIKRILNRDGAYVFYAHPWEFDPEQPRVNQASSIFKFRHYINLYKTESRLRRLIENFVACRFVTCRDYLGTCARSPV